MKYLVPLACLVLLVLASTEPKPEPRWWKGNTHTHTRWSDGDSPPETVAAWYRERGYAFLVLSDHNVLSTGERWVPLAEGADVPEGAEVREGVEGMELRLATLPELRERFEAPGEFLFIQGEELSADAEGVPVHVNGLNLAEPIARIERATILETLQASVDAVVAQGERLGRPVLAHVNHPNYRWALSAREIAALQGERFFEVYNGHPYVANAGDAEHPSTERMWDVALTLRLTELDLGLLYGLATDDAHNFRGDQGALPGRGWIQVRCATLDTGAVIEAMKRGDFYSSSGVELEGVHADGRQLSVALAPTEDETLTTTFIGTLRTAPDEVGRVLHRTTDDPAVYRFTGEELYVRAKVESSRLDANGDAPAAAWVQPVLPGDER